MENLKNVRKSDLQIKNNTMDNQCVSGRLDDE